MKQEDLRYPVGQYEKPEIITNEILSDWIKTIEDFPRLMQQEVTSLNEQQLDTLYREGGWTIRQVVHHCADSHMNSMMRFKLALTEDKPQIRPYFEDRWAELVDTKQGAIEPALKMLEGLHARWVILLKNLDEDELNRTFLHPEHGQSFDLRETIGNYAWHSRHHLAHIINLKNQKGWV